MIRKSHPHQDHLVWLKLHQITSTPTSNGISNGNSCSKPLYRFPNYFWVGTSQTLESVRTNQVQSNQNHETHSSLNSIGRCLWLVAFVLIRCSLGLFSLSVSMLILKASGNTITTYCLIRPCTRFSNEYNQKNNLPPTNLRHEGSYLLLTTSSLGFE